MNFSQNLFRLFSKSLAGFFCIAGLCYSDGLSTSAAHTTLGDKKDPNEQDENWFKLFIHRNSCFWAIRNSHKVFFSEPVAKCQLSFF